MLKRSFTLGRNGALCDVYQTVAFIPLRTFVDASGLDWEEVCANSLNIARSKKRPFQDTL